MKNLIYSLTIALFFGVSAFSQTQDWNWAKSAGGTDNDYIYSVATDGSGNVYVTGYYKSSSLIFGTTTLTNTNAGKADMFIVKYDGSGNVLWAKNTGGTEDDYSYSVATDGSGNVYVTGYFYSSSITFGTTTLTNTSSGNADMYIVKYDGNGNVLWAKSAGGTYSDGGNKVTTDGSGNVYLTGFYFNSSITFGSTTLTNTGSDDIFIVKYDSNGNILWAKSAGGTSDDISKSIAVDGSGNVYLTGYFNSSTITFGSTTLTNKGAYDAFIVKYDNNGNVLWAKSAGGSAYDYSSDISTDNSGNVYITGYFSSTFISFGTKSFTNTGSTTYDMYIVKYDSSGNILWAKSAGEDGTEYSNSITTDGSGNVYVIGDFGSASLTFGTTTLTNPNSSNYASVIFIVKYDGSGNVLWAKSAGGTASDCGISIATDRGDNVLVAGFYSSSSISFGATTLMNTNSKTELYTVKLGNATNTGIKEINGKEGAIIYPNPATSSFTVTTGGESTIEIYTINGTKLLNKHITSSGNIPLNNMPAGLYFVKIISDTGVETKTIMVTK